MLTSKEVTLSHVKLILYSEELARLELSGHINSLVSDVDIRPKISVAICRGKAEDFLKEVEPVLEASPARYYDLMLSSFNYTGESAGSELISFYTNGQAIDREASAVIAENPKTSFGNESDNNSKFFGLAVFKGGKMVGEISPELTTGHLLVTNGLEETIITVEDIEDPTKPASITLRQSRGSKIDVNIENNTPKVKITIFIDSHLESSSHTTDYLDDNNKHKLNIAIEKKVSEIVTEYLNKLKELDSDIAGIGRYAKSTCLTWKEFEDLKWQEIFKNSEFEVITHANLNVSRIIFHRIPNQA